MRYEIHICDQYFPLETKVKWKVWLQIRVKTQEMRKLPLKSIYLFKITNTLLQELHTFSDQNSPYWKVQFFKT